MNKTLNTLKTKDTANQPREFRFEDNLDFKFDYDASKKERDIETLEVCGKPLSMED